MRYKIHMKEGERISLGTIKADAFFISAIAAGNDRREQKVLVINEGLTDSDKFRLMAQTFDALVLYGVNEGLFANTDLARDFLFGTDKLICAVRGPSNEEE